MGKDPVLPLYYNDITTSTQDWTDEEFGAYMRLLIHQWRQGGLPNDYQRLTRIATSLATTWPMLKSKFVDVDGLLKNTVMEEIRTKRAKFLQKQKNNVNKRYQTSTKQDTKNVPLEIENEIENKVLDNRKESAIFTDEYFGQLFDDITLGDYQMAFRHIDVLAELDKFKLKVRKSPNEYKTRDSGGMRFAFQYHLSRVKVSPTPVKMRKLDPKDFGL